MNNINLIGLGVVGSALYNTIKSPSSISVYDQSTELFTDQVLKDNSLTFICVDTPMFETGEQDSSNITKILDELVRQNYKGLVVIKSTVLYNNINWYLSLLNIVMNPEFLNQSTANDDFKNEQYQVIGGPIKYAKQLADFYKTSCEFNFPPEGFNFEFCTVKEAIDFKYMRNIKLAMNVIYWDMVYELTTSSEKIYNMMCNIPTSENHIVGMGGYRGYGQSGDKSLKNFSACLDKDIYAKYKETKNPFLKSIIDYNDNLIKDSK